MYLKNCVDNVYNVANVDNVDNVDNVNNIGNVDNVRQSETILKMTIFSLEKGDPGKKGGNQIRKKRFPRRPYWAPWKLCFLSDLGKPGSDLWVPMSLSDCADLTDVTLADKDTNSIVIGKVNRAIISNAAMQVMQPGGQLWKQCK